MKNLIFANKLITPSESGYVQNRNMANQWDCVTAARNAFNINQQQHAKLYAKSPQVNVGAAQIPTDAWRQYDETTQRVFRTDEGQGFMAELMGVSKSLDIGKTVNLYRFSNDTLDATTISMSGQEKPVIDHVNYDFEGDPVPIFMNGFGRGFREWSSHMAENFDSMSDDQEAKVAELKRSMALYILDGDSKTSVQGYAGQGIRNHRNTQAISLSAIDLTLASTSADDIYNHFATGLFSGAFYDNLLARPMKIWVSVEIWRNLQREYSGASGQKEGTLLDRLMRIAHIDAINYTYELSGNEYFAYVLDQKYIRPLVGQAMATTAMIRNQFNDPYNFMNYSAMGLQIKKDNSGKSGVFYASA